MLAFLPGFLTSLGLITAIGAQNAFVIRQGLTRKHVLLVVAICAISDAVLIALGIGGLGLIVSGLPWLLETVRWFGVAYLLWFAFSSFKKAFQNQSMQAEGEATDSAKKVALTILGLTFLNPHVYLDTVILLGSLGNQFGEDRWIFAFGAALGSMVWFAGIGWGARLASRFMSRPIFWKILDTAIGVVMVTIALFLALFDFS